MPAAAIIGSALIGGGLSYLGSKKQADAARMAASTQANAANDAAQTEWNIYRTSRSDLAPWVQAGGQGLNYLASLMQPGGALTEPFDDSRFVLDPGYNFRLGQGEKAIRQLAASRGQFYSGNMGRALADYNQAAAGNEFANAYARYMNNQNALYNRLAGLANMGRGAAGSLGRLGADAANSAGRAYLSAGDAMANGYLNAADAAASGYQGISGGLGRATKNYLDYALDQ